ncbi:(6-4)DNA photolyase [Rhododendron vialii]|uniref:(6-4)DNA photolyase n=1 Tax=Rhododendron vialii TaxID=182163 RepID=UPI00265FC80A|nr:(6-4)DNA photolyase [Rhododendron vialii]
MRLSLSLSTPHASFLRFTTLSPTPPMASGSNSLVWFRKGIRIHDNPALEYAAKESSYLYPVFVIDPRYMEPDPTAFSPGSARAGVNRIRFLLESLADLDSSLRKLGSRLLVLKGEPGEVLFRCLKEWDIKRLCFEYDTEPYYQALDIKVKNYASAAGIEVFSPVSHTLFNPADIIQKNSGRPPSSYQSFLKIAGQPPWASSPLSTTISSLPPIGIVENCGISNVPTLQELGYEDSGQDELTPFRGGESEALKRLRGAMDDKERVAKFEKPKGDPSAFLRPATTVLSPYLKFGCLSSRYFYQCIQDVQKNVKSHTLPPVSLLGQLLWRDFFYTAAFGTPNFDRMNGNRICKQIPWNVDDELLAAWRDARTGFPWIDAIMVQLQKWGWMHHLARHCVACFLTRGDLFIHWEKGRDVFERLLIDSDWAINNGNWLWLSCSSFFYQYNRIYSPISFGKKYDPNGDYIRHFLPILKDMPKEYIYEPWTAPLSIQTKAKCIIGKDYPKPVVSHGTASKECKNKLAEAYELNKTRNGAVNEEDLKILRRKFEENQSQEPKSKRVKNKS